MQARDSLPIPVQVRKHQESFIIRPFTAVVPQENVFLLRPAIDDIPNPIQATLLPLPLHRWPHMLRIDLRRFSYHTNSLTGIFLNMLLRAGIDEIEL